MEELALDPELPRGIPDDGRATVVTIGTFDGVHRGHWTVLQEIRRRADAVGGRSVLLTFHPHPLSIVRPELAPPLLTTPSEKKEILAESGLDWAVFLTFSPALSRYEPRRFVEEILVGRLRASEVVVGCDHRFGKGRSGDVDLLRSLGEELDFTVDVVEAVHDDSDPISSTRIREAVQRGDLEAAREGLGRPYFLRAPVVRGEGRGQDLGFPTANLLPPGGGGKGDKLLPPEGIYAVWGVLSQGTFPGALHLGPRPTFQGSPPTIELHLMDFQGDLYGEEVRVDFVKRLREIRPFPGPDSLVDQMREDVEEARRVLEGR